MMGSFGIVSKPPKTRMYPSLQYEVVWNGTKDANNLKYEASRIEQPQPEQVSSPDEDWTNAVQWLRKHPGSTAFQMADGLGWDSARVARVIHRMNNPMKKNKGGRLKATRVYVPVSERRSPRQTRIGQYWWIDEKAL